ncbi:MAG: PD-(D/E)XK nuclease family protein [Campylobacterales bacterium]|nr:PD-(D/E)XK nuclease family protein [Campylobacterales bacterium]
MKNSEFATFFMAAKSAVLATEQNSASSGGGFNIFSILGVEHKEVTTHSALLRELLDPKGSHAQGDKFLIEFLKVIDFLGFDTKNTSVHAELNATEGLGRMDVVLDEPNNLIVIENKIYAPDQKNQLERYEKYAKMQNKNHRIFYLTLDGKEAEEQESEGVDYHAISYKSEILEWIENCLQLAIPPRISYVLHQYKDTIRQLTNQASAEIEMEIEKILDTVDNIKIANAIYQSFPSILTRKELLFWKSVAKELENITHEFGYKVATIDEDTLLHDLRNRPKQGVNCIWIKTETYADNKYIWVCIGFDGYSPKLYLSVSPYDEIGENHLGDDDHKYIASRLAFKDRKYYKYICKNYDMYNYGIIKLLENQNDHIFLEDIQVELENFFDLLAKTKF